jgi:two-component system response regulator VicR
MVEHRMTVVPESQQDWNFAMVPARTDTEAAPVPDGHIYLCGKCGIIVARNLSKEARVAGTIRCGNCGALNMTERRDPGQEPAAKVEKREVAVLDDEQGVLDVLCTLIAMEGFQPICLDHPRQMETMRKESHPALFLIDIMLPGTNGIEVARHLRNSGFADTPMVAMSASGSMVTEARSSGLFQDVIPKPFEVDTIVEAVERYAA